MDGTGMTYQDFIASKRLKDSPSGLDLEVNHLMMFDFQRAITRWALKRGRAAVFAGTGLGKGLISLKWSHCLHEATKERAIIVAPLAVSKQFEREGEKFNLPVKYLRADDGKTPIVVTNYEMIDKFKPSSFTSIVLDEGSILKAFTGKFRNKIISEWGQVKYRLSATATPSPNDIMELGNQAEFLGVMSRTEMLSRFFVHDGGETQKWRLKGHAQGAFWEWVCSWAVMIERPSDLGYSDDGFILPPLNMHQVTIETTIKDRSMLFAMEAQTLQERQRARRDSTEARVAACAKLVAERLDEPWCIWCNLNVEGNALQKAIPGAVQIQGSDKPEDKEARLMGFIDGKRNILISKPLICGFGINLQHCANVVFVGLSDSWEQMYQAVRRFWRFGQTKPVNVYVITADTEGAVVRNIERKEKQATEMRANMIAHMKDISTAEIKQAERLKTDYKPDQKILLPSFL